MRRTLVTAIALALLGAAPAFAHDGQHAAQAAHAAPPVVEATTQLPRTVRPTHYAIRVTPHADTLDYDASVEITLEVLEATDRIVLHAADMTFANAELQPANGKVQRPTVTTDAATQTATFAFGARLAPGRYVLRTDYAGKIGTQANGLFAIDYDTPEGRKRALYTQFENSDARRFVPSWDEPNHKATFALTATIPAAQMAVSNMPVTGTKPLGNGLKQVQFATSPRMSTYLLFFALGDFERATAQAGNTEVGVVTQKGKLAQARFALESQVALLREYNDYFGVPYPLPKLDNIASPGRSQFFSAMENWGAIFTFEHTLLLDPAISTASDRQRIFSVDAHEIAHQWFGDLVTMSWWDDLWLNEGFASWMAGRTTAKLHPEWNTAINSVFARDSAMNRDAVASTHPVVQHVETVEQASQAFDAITYSKGASVIRMLEAYVGADAWRTGVRNYMKRHAYGNTVSDDLWRQMEAAAGKPILDVAHDFTLQPGVPLVEVTGATCRDGRTTVQMAQGEFTKDRPGKAPLRWRVPVTAQVAGHAAATTLLTGGQGTLQLDGCGALVVNAGQSGYFRTLYAPAQFAALRGGYAKLAPIDQLGVLQDTWALGMAGRQPASDWLELAVATPVDATPQLWSEIAGGLESIDRYYAGDATRRARFRAFATKTLAPVFARVGWQAKPGEPDQVTILRTRLIGTLGALGDPAVVAEARRRHAAQASDPSAMPVDLRKTLLGVVAQHADAATWDAMRAQARAETTPLVKDLLYVLLASTDDMALARRALELALTDEPGATISAEMLSAVSAQHPDLAFDFAAAHVAQVDARVDTTSRSRYYPGLASNSLDAAMVGKLRAFADAHIAASSRRATDAAIDNITYRSSVRRDRLPAIDAWLERRVAAK